MSSGKGYRHWLPPVALLAIGQIGLAAVELEAADPGQELFSEVAGAAGIQVLLERSAQVVGDLHSNGGVTLEKDSRVEGNVTLSGTLANHQGTITGSVTQVAPRELPAIPTESEARALADRVFEQDTVFTGAVIDDVVFVAGTARISGSVSGKGTVIATGDIEVEAMDPWPPPFPPEPQSQLSVIAGNAVTISAGIQEKLYRGTVLAGLDVSLGTGVRVQGAVVAHRKLIVRSSAVLVFELLDGTPPEITDLAPPDGAFVPAAQVEVSAALADDRSGVDPQSVVLRLDAVDRTAEATITAERVVLPAGDALADGAHTVEISVADLAGNSTATAWSFGVDTVPPSLAFTEPVESLILNDPAPRIALAFADGTSGVDPATLELLLDGAAITDRCFVTATEAFCRPPELPSAVQTATASVRDRAGHPAVAALTFETRRDVTGPEVTFTSPVDGALLDSSAVQVTGTARDDGELVSLHVNRQEATLDGGTFQATVELGEGPAILQAVAEDWTGKQGFAAVLVTVDTTAPLVRIETPEDGSLTNASTIVVSGEVLDSSPIAALTVAGEAATLGGERFEREVALAPGSSTVVVQATDAAGNVGQAEVGIDFFHLPEVRITEPADLATIAATTVPVRGTVDDPAGQVEVNGVPATVLADGGFLAEGVPLVEGGNVLTATLRASDGAVNTASIHVVRDLTPPRVEITTPADGAVVHTASVAVSGLVNDIVAGTVNAQEATVTVNGVPAAVRNRNFLAAGVALDLGENLLTVTAVDESGNVGQRTAWVVREDPAGTLRIEKAAGDLQQGVARTELPEPLQVVVRAAGGSPLAGRTVVFEEESGGGHLDGGKRRTAAVTDAQGLASARWTLGRRAGVQQVKASAVGVLGAVPFTALAGSREAAFIVVDAGDQQVGTAGQRLPRPLLATVTDDGFNRLGGVPVEWTVVKGMGHFGAGESSLIVETDSDGRAIATLVLDSAEGVASNAVTARIVGLPEGPVASFTASGKAAGEAAATAVTGVVLDNTNRPVAGVTIRLDGTALWTRTDAEGQFRIDSAPVGEVLMIVDGSTAERPGVWASLEFRLTTIPGRDNDVRMSIYLLPLDVAGGLYVDEVTGGVLTVPEVPGLTLEVLPGTVTFPGGSKSGVVSVTVVHSDRVPMVPNFGQQPRLIVTIQPAGARFDPPAKITYPNVEGLAPGESTDLYSFDHDLGHFVSIGPGTVSDDGTLLVSDPGVGILKAGWHCGGDPQSSTGTPHACPVCQTCSGSACVPDLGQACGEDGGCIVNERCTLAGCRGEPVFIEGVNALGSGLKNVEAKAGEAIPFTSGPVDSNCEQALEYEWDFGDGSTSTLANPLHSFEREGSYAVRLTVRCPHCATATEMSVVNVVIFCPVPVNWRKVSAGPAGFSLQFEYAWNSSTGPASADLADLDQCDVHERVEYPSSASNFQWPHPWNHATINPTELQATATAGRLQDTHDPAHFRDPLVPASFTAIQKYYYTCRCLANPNVEHTLAGNIALTRSVVQLPNGDFQYIITKDGESMSFIIP